MPGYFFIGRVELNLHFSLQTRQDDTMGINGEKQLNFNIVLIPHCSEMKQLCRFRTTLSTVFHTVTSLTWMMGSQLV
jgi:hypothetical protein